MSAPSHPSCRFTLTADAAPGLLPRVLNPFAKRDVVPERMEAQRHGDGLHVSIACRDLDPADARLIRADLLRLVGLRTLDIASDPARLAA